MEQVASYLQEEAVRRIGNVEADQFARTAFNRYYYATFLEVRAQLGTLKPEWSSMLAHAAMPELLRGSVKTALANGRKRATKADDHKIAVMCQDALLAATELANLLDEGRATRVTADYHPDVPVDFNTVFSFELNRVEVKTARQWPNRAKVYMNSIVKAWRQIHV